MNKNHFWLGSLLIPLLAVISMLLGDPGNALQIICLMTTIIIYFIVLNKSVKEESFGRSVLVSIGFVIISIIITIILSLLYVQIACGTYNTSDMCGLTIIYLPMWLGLGYIIIFLISLLWRTSAKIWKERLKKPMNLIYLIISLGIILLILLYLFLPSIL